MKYHHGDLKGALVKSACIVCEKSGYEKLSLRSIAKEANVSQTAPYRHFKTKQDLLAEVAKCGFEELRQNMKKSLQKNKDLNAKEKFIEMGMEYLNFGLNKQKTFDLMNHADLYFPDFPELEKIFLELQQIGNPRLTGTGSSMFLSFNNQEEALNKYSLFPEGILVKSIDHSPLMQLIE